jgi:uncharacterized damage-inducible protein DinB
MRCPPVALAFVFAFELALSVALATPLAAQHSAADPDPMVASIQAGAQHVRGLFEAAADRMSAEDYRFAPTAEVRSFGELLVHVAESNLAFCAVALGTDPPEPATDPGPVTRDAIRSMLTDSFEFCDHAFERMADAGAARAPRTFHGQPLPALAVLNFRNYHALLHWGNAITYMRLRGRVPPST